jgi:sucrose-phosphate synthase
MASERNPGRLYILLISVHGLIRGENLELGRDADTGGQTKYVVELSRALARHPSVARVDLVTRRVSGSGISADYARPVERLASHARIIRIDAGPADYLAKEQLWPHLDSFADNLSSWLQQQPRQPDILHSHYADAGYVGVRLARASGIPLVHTGHSLGRDKCRRLLGLGLAMEQIESTYHMKERFAAEEMTLSTASLIITSTRNEIEDQYELYDFYTPEKMAVIPPGTDLQKFFPPQPPAARREPHQPALSEEDRPPLGSFLQDPHRPMILALSRPDERKNLITLVEAYGESDRLRAIANLVIVVGNRDDLRDLGANARAVLLDLLIAIDCHNLYGLVAIPKHHTPEEIPLLYRRAAASGGVFINPALTEPFGLTLLEATASGLPVVATENGGPVDILANCRNGLLIDPLDKGAIQAALLQILEDRRLWRRFAESGIDNVARHYSWDAHAERYIGSVLPLVEAHRAAEAIRPHAPVPVVERSATRRNRAIVTAIDNTLLGDAESLEEFIRMVRRERRRFVFGIATGRRLDTVLKILRREGIPTPDVLITSLGTEITYSRQLIGDIAWSEHIDHIWTPQVLRRLLRPLPGLKLQPLCEQSRFKVSYFYDSELAPPIEEIQSLLRQQELTVNATLSFGQYLDIVPQRASKGQALRYVADQWGIPLERILVTGGSGGDDDMLRGNTLGVVVANRHSEELVGLSESERVFFAEGAHARGILEAIEHYRFFAC